MKLLILVVVLSFAIGAIGPRNGWWWRQVLPSCVPGGSSWYHADKASCSRFYQCYNGTVKHFNCPPGTFLKLNSSDVPEGCRPRWEVDCGNRPDRCVVAPFCLIRLRISVQVPMIPDTVYDFSVPQMPLIYAMRLLAQQASSPTFSFESRSHAFFGEFIVTINGLPPSPANQYWSIQSAPNIQLQVGASSYIPSDQEHIIFKLTAF